MTYSIYVLVDPRDLSYRYVGCTQKPKRRLSLHVHHSGSSFSPCSRWVRELSDIGLRPSMLIVQEAHDADEASGAERGWIFRLREFGCPLLNVVRGGVPQPKPYRRVKYSAQGPRAAPNKKRSRYVIVNIVTGTDST